MHIIYIDEAGCTGSLPTSNTAIQPVFCLCGVIVNQQSLAQLTHDLMQLKQRFFPGKLPATSTYQDLINLEIKGADIRKEVRSTSRNKRRYSHAVIDAALKILENHSAKIIGRIYIKPIGGNFDGSAVYSFTVQKICEGFQHYLLPTRPIIVYI